MGQSDNFETVHPLAENRDLPDQFLGMALTAADWSDAALSSGRVGKLRAV